MLSIEMDTQNDIAVIEPRGPLSENDFKSASYLVDPYIEKHGRLKGIIIHSRYFPGWDSFAGLVSHMRFIKDHHKKISRLAIVTDSSFGNFAEKIGSHFINAEIKTFPFEEMEKAKSWISEAVIP